jgi:hypothetical protein
MEIRPYPEYGILGLLFPIILLTLGLAGSLVLVALLLRLLQAFLNLFTEEESKIIDTRTPEQIQDEWERAKKYDEFILRITLDEMTKEQNRKDYEKWSRKK